MAYLNPVILKLEILFKNKYIYPFRPILAVIFAFIFNMLAINIFGGFITFGDSTSLAVPFYKQIIWFLFCMVLVKIDLKIILWIAAEDAALPLLISGYILGVINIFIAIIVPFNYFILVLILIASFLQGLLASRKVSDRYKGVDSNRILEEDSNFVVSMMQYIYHPIFKTVLGALIVSFGSFFAGLYLIMHFVRGLVGSFLIFGSVSIPPVSFWMCLLMFISLLLSALCVIYIGYSLIHSLYLKVTTALLVIFSLLVNPAAMFMEWGPGAFIWNWTLKILIVVIILKYHQHFKKINNTEII